MSNYRKFPEFIRKELEAAFGDAFEVVDPKERDLEPEDDPDPIFKLKFFEADFVIENHGNTYEAKYGIQPYNTGRCDEYWQTREGTDWIKTFKADIFQNLHEMLEYRQEKITRLEAEQQDIMAFMAKLKA